MPDGVIPVPPDGIRPGQLGVVLLGRVIIGDIAATLVDLSARGMLAVEEHDEGGQAGWLLRPEATAQQRATLLSYEATLLSAVSDGAQPATIQSLAPRMPQVLSRAREEIVHEAVSNGWLHRFHDGQRTGAGSGSPCGSGGSSATCGHSPPTRARMLWLVNCCPSRCTSVWSSATS